MLLLIFSASVVSLVQSARPTTVAERVIIEDEYDMKITEKICKKTCNDDSDCIGKGSCVFWGTCPHKRCIPNPRWAGYGVVDRCHVCNPNKGANMTNPDCGSREECVFSPWCRAWACFLDYNKPFPESEESTATTLPPKPLTTSSMTTTATKRPRPFEFCNRPIYDECCNSHGPKRQAEDEETEPDSESGNSERKILFDKCRFCECEYSAYCRKEICKPFPIPY